MHIPSEQVYNEMRSSDCGIWYVPANGGTELALLIKAPTPCIKALMAGCRLELIFGKFENYLCVGVIIYDIPDAPITIPKLQHRVEEHATLMSTLNERKIPLFLFGEMDTCLAESTVVISEAEASTTLNLLGAESNLYVGERPDIESHILDCFCYTYDKQCQYPNAHEIPVATVVAQCGKWSTINHFYYGTSDTENIIINDKNEGEMLEKIVWSTLISVFPDDLYHSPRNKEARCELTDVLAAYSYGSFLIETKDVSVFKSGCNRNQNRRISGVQKQVKKAIGQLVGAAKAFSRGDEITDSDGNVLNIARSIPPHCIVLITELMCSGDWEDIVMQMRNAAKETKAFFHLLDLNEFINLLKGSSGNPRLFDSNLLARFELFWKAKNVFIRGEPFTNTDVEKESL